MLSKSIERRDKDSIRRSCGFESVRLWSVSVANSCFTKECFFQLWSLSLANNTQAHTTCHIVPLHKSWYLRVSKAAFAVHCVAVRAQEYWLVTPNINLFVILYSINGSLAFQAIDEFGKVLGWCVRFCVRWCLYSRRIGEPTRYPFILQLRAVAVFQLLEDVSRPVVCEFWCKTVITELICWSSCGVVQLTTEMGSLGV